MLTQPETACIDLTKGFLHNNEGMRLHELALEVGHLGPCLEVGSYCGKSAVYLGSACSTAKTALFTVDHHRGSEEQQPGEEYFDPALYNISSGHVDTLPALCETIETAGLSNTVIPVVGASITVAKFWRTPLSLVFIDGGHSYESARADADAWLPHILPGGYLAIHDIFPDPATGGQGPFQVYTEIINTGRFAPCPMTETLGVLKCLSAGPE